MRIVIYSYLEAAISCAGSGEMLDMLTQQRENIIQQVRQHTNAIRCIRRLPVVVHSVGVFEYYIEPSGPSIEATSPTSLLPGNYGLYHNGG
jgi:hypothetical protein